MAKNIIKEICELNKYANFLMDKYEDEIFSQFNFRTNHVFNIELERQNKWSGLHSMHYTKYLSSDVLKIINKERYIRITTNSGLNLAYIIDYKKNSFFAMPVK